MHLRVESSRSHHTFEFESVSELLSNLIFSCRFISSPSILSSAEVSGWSNSCKIFAAFLTFLNFFATSVKNMRSKVFRFVSEFSRTTRIASNHPKSPFESMTRVSTSLLNPAYFTKPASTIRAVRRLQNIWCLKMFFARALVTPPTSVAVALGEALACQSRRASKSLICN